MAKLRFLIASPRYNLQTAGVMVLRELCDMLNRQGYEAAIALFGGGGPHFHWAFSNSPEFYHPEHQRTQIPFEGANQAIRDYLQGGVVIYPDLVPDNPLAGPSVLRYLLCKNHGYQPQGPHEMVLTFFPDVSRQSARLPVQDLYRPRTTCLRPPPRERTRTGHHVHRQGVEFHRVPSHPRHAGLNRPLKNPPPTHVAPGTI